MQVFVLISTTGLLSEPGQRGSNVCHVRIGAVVDSPNLNLARALWLQGKLRDLLQPALPVEGMAAPPEAAPGQARTDP